MRFLLLLLFLKISLFASIGKISALNGKVVIDRQKQLLDANIGFDLEEKDLILTDDKSKAQITLNDGTVLSLGKNSTLNINEYVFDEKETSNSKADFKFVEGTFKSITGAIGKVAPEKFKLETKSASIGIRGTIVVGNQEKVACTQGQITVTSAGVTQVLGAGMMTNTEMGKPPTTPSKIEGSLLKEVDSVGTKEESKSTAGENKQKNTENTTAETSDNNQTTEIKSTPVSTTTNISTSSFSDVSNSVNNTTAALAAEEARKKAEAEAAAALAAEEARKKAEAEVAAALAAEEARKKAEAEAAAALAAEEARKKAEADAIAAALAAEEARKKAEIVTTTLATDEAKKKTESIQLATQAAIQAAQAALTAQAEAEKAAQASAQAAIISQNAAEYAKMEAQEAASSALASSLIATNAANAAIAAANAAEAAKVAAISAATATLAQEASLSASNATTTAINASATATNAAIEAINQSKAVENVLVYSASINITSSGIGSVGSKTFTVGNSGSTVTIATYGPSNGTQSFNYEGEGFDPVLILLKLNNSTGNYEAIINGKNDDNWIAAKNYNNAILNLNLVAGTYKIFVADYSLDVEEAKNGINSGTNDSGIVKLYFTSTSNLIFDFDSTIEKYSYITKYNNKAYINNLTYNVAKSEDNNAKFGILADSSVGTAIKIDNYGYFVTISDSFDNSKNKFLNTSEIDDESSWGYWSQTLPSNDNYLNSAIDMKSAWISGNQIAAPSTYNATLQGQVIGGVVNGSNTGYIKLDSDNVFKATIDVDKATITNSLIQFKDSLSNNLWSGTFDTSGTTNVNSQGYSSSITNNSNNISGTLSGKYFGIKNLDNTTTVKSIGGEFNMTNGGAKANGVFKAR